MLSLARLSAAGTETTKTPSKHIYLVQGPIHTDFVIPLDQHSRAAMEAIGYDLSQTPEAQTLIIGWGGAAFYTTIGTYRDVSARAIWNSVMGDASVLRIDVTGPVPANVELPLIPLTMISTQNSLRE